MLFGKMRQDQESLKSQRDVARTKATKLVKDLNALWSQKEKADSDDLAYTINLAEKHFVVLNSVQDELDAHDIPDDTHHLQDLDELVFKYKRLLTRLDRITESRLGPNVALPSSCATVKIKLDSCLPTFKGDILFWPEFWNLFLRGLSTTTENYDVAVSILKQRFGN